MRKGDPLGNYLEDKYWAEHGVHNGSNAHLIDQIESDKRARAMMQRDMASAGRATRPSQPTFPGIERFFARIPEKLKRFVLAICFVLPFFYCLRHGFDVLWSAGAGLAGMVVVAVTYQLLIVSVKAVAMLVYLTFFAGIALAIFWFITKL